MRTLIALLVLLHPVSACRGLSDADADHRELNCQNRTEYAPNTHVVPAPSPQMYYDPVPTSSYSTAMPTPTALAAINSGNHPALAPAGSHSYQPPVVPATPMTNAPVAVSNEYNPSQTDGTLYPPVVLTNPPTLAPVTTITQPAPLTGAPTRQPTPSPTPAPTNPPVTPAPTLPPVAPPTLTPVVLTPAPVPIPVVVPQPNIPDPPVDDCFDCFDFITPAGATATEAENISAQSGSEGIGTIPLIGVSLGGMIVVAGVVLASRHRCVSSNRRSMAVAAAGESIDMEEAEDSFEPDSPMSAKDSLALHRFSARDDVQSVA